jgi:hypothetical protein
VFVGAINANCRRFFRTHAKAFNGKVCAVGCSGNFTFEQLLSRYSAPRALHSNDVSIYTCAAGAWLTGKPMKMELVDDSYAWLAEDFKDPEGQVATLVMLLELLKYRPDKGDHARRMFEHYKNNWRSYIEQTRKNLRKAQEHLKVTEFFPGDVFDFYQQFPAKGTVSLSFMPTYSGGYERLYRELDRIIEWPKPTYSMLNDERRDKIYEFLSQRDFVIYDDRKLEGLPLVFVERRGSEGRDVYLYSNLELPTGLVKKHHSIANPNFKFIGPDDEITKRTRFDFLKVPNEVVNYYREMFLAKNIDYVDGQLPLLVFADGKLFGFMIFTIGRYGGAQGGLAYGLSDFVVPYSKYPRLSKLLVLIMTTKELQRLIAEHFWIDIKTIMTTAFTHKPASAKYRGVFKLEKRGDGFLNYTAEAGTRTLKAARNEWLRKFSKL